MVTHMSCRSTCLYPELTLSDPSLAVYAYSHLLSHAKSISPKIRQRWCRWGFGARVVSLSLPHCIYHQGLQMRLMQLQAVSQLQRELNAQHAGGKLQVYCSKLARGIFSRLGAKFEYRAGERTSHAKIF